MIVHHLLSTHGPLVSIKTWQNEVERDWVGEQEERLNESGPGRNQLIAATLSHLAAAPSGGGGFAAVPTLQILQCGSWKVSQSQPCTQQCACHRPAMEKGQVTSGLQIGLCGGTEGDILGKPCAACCGCRPKQGPSSAVSLSL